MALNNMAMAHGRLGRHDEAAAAFRQAIELHTAGNYLPESPWRSTTSATPTP